jgi:hypothetical protein
MRKLLTLREKSFSENGAQTYEQLWAKAKAAGYAGLEVGTVAEFKAVGDGKTFHAIFSTDIEDRHREIVYQDFDIKNFKRNSVFLDSHYYGSIEAILGRILNLKAKKGAPLEGEIEYALENPRGMLAYRLTEGGFLKATSIGFIPLEFDDKGNILRSELLEISAVSVPANPEAIIGEKGLETPEDVPETPEVPEAVPVDPAPEPEIAPVSPEPEPKAPVEPEPPTVTAAAVVDAIKAETHRKTALLKEIASEVQAIAAPGARKRAVMQALRAVISDT